MKITVQADRENDQLYVALSKDAFNAGSVARSVRVTDDIALDFDSGNKLVGIDVINASRRIGLHVDQTDSDELPEPSA
jgi:uncharacterized protein YuzE